MGERFTTGRTAEPRPADMPDRIYRCACGAMLKDLRSVARHVNGETACQHRKLWVYQPAGMTVLESLPSGETDG